MGNDNLYDINANDPDHELVQRTHIAPQDVAQITELMSAFGDLRDAERALSEASRRYMQLNETDMLALQFLIVAGNRGQIVTPSAIAQHLAISTPSTTKLLDRLERDGHITRSTHPSDRRALAIAITPATRRAAMETVGKQHAKRFDVAARYSSAERAILIRFLRETAAEIALGDEPWAQPGAQHQPQKHDGDTRPGA
ncbi:MarR family winged helix-turn-helix transcriptional regulator [Haematomicrobium sanguinis]|uniref:MarR family winged helix-turn-helix transcriptional regulator n=1 Tax=Haematomicrobium sanguinis TaxID=479106 RepID=UPI00068C5966|nr:MarR family transcriptional regulator [Haematomicrobium sanguinis]